MWNLIYHEMLGVNNLGREISGAQLDKRELVLHHKDTAAEIKRGEQNIRFHDGVYFIKGKSSCTHLRTSIAPYTHPRNYA